MTDKKRLLANEDVLDECSEVHDVLTDTLTAFEDLYYEMETAPNVREGNGKSEWLFRDGAHFSPSGTRNGASEWLFNLQP